MLWTQMFIVALVTAVTVALLGHALHRAGPRHAFTAASSIDGGETHSHHRWQARWAGAGHRPCGDRPSWRAVAVATEVEERLRLAAAQRPAWQRLVEAAQTAGRSLDDACAALATRPTARTAMDALDRIDVMLVVGADALQQVRPAFDAFYAALDDGQRRTLDGWFAGRASGWPL